MYESLIQKLDEEIKHATIKKTHTQVIQKDLNTAVDSLIEESSSEESTAVFPIEKIETQDINTIPDLSSLEKIKKPVIVQKIDQTEIPSLKRKKDVVWL